jgi:hypothetical protein
MKAFRSVLVFGLVVGACDVNVVEASDQAISESASEGQAITTSSPPKLLRAQEIFIQEEDSPYRGFSADILVPHVGSTKAVRVLGHNRNTGASFTIKASYSEQANTGDEVWTVRAHLTGVFDTAFVPIDVMVEQVIDGVQTVDDNGGTRYVLGAITDPTTDAARYVRNKFVLADGCVGQESGSNSFTDVSCGLDLNPAVPRGGKLTMVYTAGKKVQKSATVNCGATESCFVNVHIPASTVFKFRLSYVASGITYFDDNFRHGYVIDINHRTRIANGGWTANGAARLF